MSNTSIELLDTPIAQLEMLVAFLHEQLEQTEFVTAQTCACKEIARSLCRLIRTHRAARRPNSP